MTGPTGPRKSGPKRENLFVVDVGEATDDELEEQAHALYELIRARLIELGHGTPDDPDPA